ncbi:MAG: DNA polymerase I [Phycisphaerales bacterium]|nr:DNA polymerase I [Phycisphaerales bacterium]
MRKSLYLIDGHAQIYRAYYAPFRALTAPSGEPTRATHVFFQMLLNLVRDRKPDYLAMVLDTSDSTVFRRDIYPDYKAHREPPPEDFSPQEQRIISTLERINLPILRLTGFEADDILATLARRHEAEFDVFLVSRDKDLEQLIGPNVSLYDPMKDEVVTAERLVEIKGWTPEQAFEAQTLIGDTVDNIPGVKGIGPKTAAKLIQKYGSASGVIEHADDLTPKQRENVLAFAPMIETTRQLLALRYDVPLELDLPAAAVGRIEWHAAAPVFEELGMRRLLTQLPGYDASKSAAATKADVPADLFSGSEADASPVEESAAPDPAAPLMDRSRAERLAQPAGGEYRLIETPEQLEALVAELKDVRAVAIDTETSGARPMDAELVGVSISWQVGQGVYIPVRNVFDRAIALERVVTALSPILADERVTKVGHHLKYDLIVLENAGMPVRGPLFDTMIAAFVLDPMRANFGLSRLTRDWFGYEMIDITELIGKGRDQLRMDQVPVDRVVKYAGEDADYTWRLYELCGPDIDKSDLKKLFHEVEMPLVSVLKQMERNGITIDVDFLAEMNADMTRRMNALIDEAHAAAGATFNLDSPKQLGEILFDKLGFQVKRRTRTARSTDADTLETLARETDHPLPKLLLDYRELQKLRSTYVEALPTYRAQRDQRVHTSYHQTGAITGRLSSSDPNLQNIPIRTELGRQIRRAFIPRDPSERLIVADYSQVELRMLAHYSGDPELKRAFQEDRDIHTFVAAQVNGIPIDQVTGDMRGRAKAVNFGIIYGQTAFGLAQGTGMSRGEAQQFIDEYFRTYPRIRGYIRQCIADARQTGLVRTILGRRRPIPDIDSRNRTARAAAERLAVNTVMQGSAADLIKVAMIRLDERIRRDNLPLRMLLQVHDELVCEAPADRAEELAQIVSETMRTAIKLDVPARVDCAIGRNWLEAK